MHEKNIIFSFYFMQINIFYTKFKTVIFQCNSPPSLSNHINRNLLQYYKKIKDIVFVGMLFKLPLYSVYFLCAEPKGLKGNCSVSQLVDFYRSKNVCKHSWTTLGFFCGKSHTGHGHASQPTTNKVFKITLKWLHISPFCLLF